MSLKDIIRQSIDLHFHIGPEIIPRKFNNVIDLVKNIRGKMRGIALKNHFYSTSPFIKEIENKIGIYLIGSITLNNSVGGLNPDAIYTASALSKYPIIVWFPTISAKNFLNKSKYEIAPEWVNRNNFQAKLSKNVKGIYILNKLGNINNKTVKVLKSIKETRSILATGHISTIETKKLVDKATSIGIKKIIITHPIYQKINIKLGDQIELSKRGCFIETSFSMYSIDKIKIKKIAYQIKKIGPEKMIISSDVGQIFSVNPNIALEIFAKLLIKEGVKLDSIKRMLVVNPKKLIFG